MSVLTIGSLNLDHVLNVDHLVNPGETLAADSLATTAGGKGLNQSLAAVRAGASVLHAGAVGSAGVVLKDLLAENGCDVHLVDEVDVGQGCAFIQVDSHTGENAIVLFAGSNHALTEQRVDEILDCASLGDVVLLQNEVSCVTYALASCAKRGIQCLAPPYPRRTGVGCLRGRRALPAVRLSGAGCRHHWRGRHVLGILRRRTRGRTLRFALSQPCGVRFGNLCHACGGGPGDTMARRGRSDAGQALMRRVGSSQRWL